MSKIQLAHGLNFVSSNKVKQNTFMVPFSKPNGQLSYKCDSAKLSDHLEELGYSTLTSFGEIQVFKLKDNIAYLKSAQNVYNDLLEYIKEQRDDTLRTCFIDQVENLIVSKKRILGSMPPIKFERYKDTRDTVRLHYKNKVVVITATKVKTELYKKFRKLGKYIFFEQIIPRKYRKEDANGESDFKRFLELVTNNPIHFESVCSAIGYLVSSYKNPSVTKAIIITDILSQVKNEAYGRTGKGLIIKALSHIINVVEYNGKATDLTNDKFVFQTVTVLTDLVVLQDVTKGFLFESLFSTLTDNMSIERKHRPKISIPFSDSPKIALTTNYTIPQDTDSFKDRKHLLTLNNFFNEKNKPESHFKRLFFIDWDDKEWARFDNFMVKCVQLFLNKGLLAYDSAELKMQKLINSTSQEFVELIESEYNALNDYRKIKGIAARIEINANDEGTRSRIVGKWLNNYAAFKGYKIDRRGSNGIIKFCFTN